MDIATCPEDYSSRQERNNLPRLRHARTRREVRRARLPRPSPWRRGVAARCAGATRPELGEATQISPLNHRAALVTGTIQFQAAQNSILRGTTIFKPAAVWARAQAGLPALRCR